MLTTRFKYFAMLPAAILILGIVMTLTMGANLGIDFTGGTTFTIDMGEDFDTADVTKAVKDNGINDAVVLKSGETASSRTQAVIRMHNFADDDAEKRCPPGYRGTAERQVCNVR